MKAALPRTPRVLAACCLLLAACAGEEPQEERGSGPPPVTLSIAGWRVEHAAAVGGADAGREQQLYNVVSVAEDPEGRFYALNYGDKRVIVFDSLGRHVRTLGRTGKGPGEFTSPADLAVVGTDGLYVMDLLQRRVSRFRRSDGSHLSDLPLLTGAQFLPREMEVSPDGRVMLEVRSARTARSKGPIQPRILVLDTLRGQPAHERTVVMDTISQVEVKAKQGNGERAMVMDIPFAPRPVWTVDASGGVLFGNGAEYVLFRQGAGGRREVALRGQGGERLPVTRRDQDRFFAEPALKPFLGKVDFPERMPFFTRVLSDRGGRLWFAVPSSERGNHWEVRDASGRRLGGVRLPGYAELVHVSPTAMYVIETDEDQVETLHRYRLVRS